MARTVLLFLLCSSAGLTLLQSQPTKTQATPPAPLPYVIPADAVKRPNPVKADPGSVAEGRRLYSTECALCHGAEGSGKTALAESMQLKLADLRDPVVGKNYTDGALFYLMHKGKGKMPPEEGRLREGQIWHLVNYLRSIVKKEPEKATPAKSA